MNCGYIVGLFLGYSVNFLTFEEVKLITASLIAVDMLYLGCLTSSECLAHRSGIIPKISNAAFTLRGSEIEKRNRISVPQTLMLVLSDLEKPYKQSLKQFIIGK